MAPLIGVILRNVAVELFPFLVLICIIIVLFATERLNRLARVRV
jgi:hypothetical protein